MVVSLILIGGLSVCVVFWLMFDVLGLGDVWWCFGWCLIVGLVDFWYFFDEGVECGRIVVLSCVGGD